MSSPHSNKAQADEATRSPTNAVKGPDPTPQTPGIDSAGTLAKIFGRIWTEFGKILQMRDGTNCKVVERATPQALKRDAQRFVCMSVAAAMQSLIMSQHLQGKESRAVPSWNEQNQFTRPAMIVRLDQREERDPRGGVAPHAVATESEMIVGNLQQTADVRPGHTLDRRLRNRLLLANLFVWILIIVALRWFFF